MSDPVSRWLMRLDADPETSEAVRAVAVLFGMLIWPILSAVLFVALLPLWLPTYWVLRVLHQRGAA